MKAILILACSVLFLGLAYTVMADSGQTIIYPQNEGMVQGSSTVGNINYTTERNTWLQAINISSSGGLWISQPFWEFNVTHLPCNISMITSTNFKVWYWGLTAAVGSNIQFIPMNSSQTNLVPINQTTTGALCSCIRTGLGSMSYLWLNDTVNLFTTTPSVINFSTWGPCYPGIAGIGATNFLGKWLNETYSSGTRNISRKILENITNYTQTAFNAKLGLLMLGIYVDPSIACNISFGTSLNTSAPVRPQLVINYTWDPPLVNSSYPANVTTLGSMFSSPTTVDLKFNLSQTHGNRTRYQLWFYNASTASWGVLQNYTMTSQSTGTALVGYSYNQSCSYTIGGLIPGATYYWYVNVIGNTTPSIHSFTCGSPTYKIRLYPTNEGYVTYESAGTSYTKQTPWADGILNLNQSKTNADFSSRIFFEWNLSHILPVDSYVSMVNFTYNASDWCGTHDTNGNWVLVPNTDGNTTNTSSAEYLFNAITTGTSMQNALQSSYWFATISEVKNRSTLSPQPVTGANHEGWWYCDFDGVQRNIRNATMDNISTGQDRMIFGYYIPAGGAGVCAGNIPSTINTSSTQRPQLYMNVSYNMSTSLGSTFTNNSVTLRQPTVTFDVNNTWGQYISYYVMLYNTSSSTWLEERFVRRGTDGTQSIKLYNASERGTEYYWYYGIVGSTYASEMYHFTVGYGEVNFCLRYENISSNNRNELINITEASGDPYNQSRHRLVIHYANSSSTELWFDWETYATNDYLPNQTVSLQYTPIFYEFTWNYSVNDTATNYTSQYTRILTPHSATYEGTDEIITFYLTTDEYVYNQYYIQTNASGTTSTVLADDINALVDYSYLFDDQSGYFNPQNTYSTYASIFTYVGTSRIVIDERYIDAAAKVNPTLKYHSYYYVGIASTINTQVNDYYTNLGLIPTERVTSPYTETIVIYPLGTDTAEVFSNVSYQFNWLTTGFYVHYLDTSGSTQRLMFTVWNVTNHTNTFLAIVYVNGSSDYNYTYTTADAWHDNITYKISVNISYEFDSGVTKSFTMNSIYIFKAEDFRVSGAWINTILTTILGPSPFYNSDTGTTIAYIDWIIMFFGILLLVTFGSLGQPVLAIGSQGILYVIATVFVSGVSTAFIVVGIFLVICAVLYAIRQGGGKE